MGMLIQKMERQPMDSVSAPPMSGPMARDPPETAPHSPTARAGFWLREGVGDDGQSDGVEHRRAESLG